MKLAMSIPERPGFMQVLPLFDVLALLLVFLTLGSTFIVEQGIAVRLPESSARLTRFLNPIELTLSGGDDPAVFVEGKRTELARIGEELQALMTERRWSSGDTVLIKADESLAMGRYAEVVEIIQETGLRAARAVRPRDSE